MRPTRQDMLMEMAIIAGKRGTCARLGVGVVIAREGRPLSIGYNGTPAGLPHCNHLCNCGSPEGSLHSSFCPAQGPCLASVHAEVNAIAWAARYGITTERAELYATDSPCANCAGLIVNAGITKLYYLRPYRDPQGLNLVRKAGIDTEWLEMIY